MMHSHRACRLAKQSALPTQGFHIRVPFFVSLPGVYAFRYHMDMGLGSFMGIDGPEFRPGNAWGHVENGGQALIRGDHEWEVLVSVTQPCVHVQHLT